MNIEPKIDISGDGNAMKLRSMFRTHAAAEPSKEPLDDPMNKCNFEAVMQSLVENAFSWGRKWQREHGGHES